MSSTLLALGVFIVGQVNQAANPYGGAVQPPPPATDASAAGADDTGLLDVLETPQTEAAAQAPAPQSSRSSAGPYGSSNAAPGGSNFQRLPPAATASPPPTNSPPPGYGQQLQQTPAARTTTAPAQPPGLKPSAMMRAMLTPPRESRLTGQPMALADVVSGATSRAEQTQRIEAYWDLCSSVADYYLGLREQEELRRLRSLVPSLGPAGQQAENELAIRIGTSQRGALASQYRLASLIGPLTGLPLPADIPHCGNYHTHYEQIFAARASVEAQELSALLPLRYAELKDAATAVTRAEEWLNLVAAARSDGSDTTGTLRALELLALRRRAFVQIARDYNRRIARYSELATPGQIDADRLIGILIKRDTHSTATRPSLPAAPPNRQSQNGASAPPSTFDEGWTRANDNRILGRARDEAVQPASGESRPIPHEERSLLVPRQ